MNDAPLSVPPSDITVADTWDAGDMGCGALVSRLRRRLRAMPGQVLYMVTRDAGAPEDIPAWCRMTRNELLRYDAQAHGFWIRSRLDW